MLVPFDLESQSLVQFLNSVLELILSPGILLVELVLLFAELFGEVPDGFLLLFNECSEMEVFGGV